MSGNEEKITNTHGLHMGCRSGQDGSQAGHLSFPQVILSLCRFSYAVRLLFLELLGNNNISLDGRRKQASHE